MFDPESTRMRSTRPSVLAASQRISTGTRVPGPRTRRSIGPRATVTIHTCETTDRWSRWLELQDPCGEDQKQDSTDHIQDPLFALARFDDAFPFHIHINRLPEQPS